MSSLEVRQMENHRNKIMISLIILLTLTVGASFRLPISVYAYKQGNVHGNVIDEKNNALYGVKVTVYSSSGILITSQYTNENGFFRFALDKGSWKISLEKDGYIMVERSFAVPDVGLTEDPENDPVKLEDIILKTALRLTASVLTRVENPGDIILLPFTISNIGDKPEEINFLTQNSAGWATRILDQSGAIKKALLASGSMNLNLEVTIPSTASGNSTVSLTVLGRTSSTLSFTIIIEEITPRIEMTSTFPYLSSEIGDSIDYPLSIANIGELAETIDLIGEIPKGWTINFITAQKTDVLQVFLKAGQSEKLTVTITPSKNATIGIYKMLIKGLSAEDELRASLNLTANLRTATENVEVVSTFQNVTVQAGKVLQYPIKLWNKGEKDAFTLLNVLSIPDDWKAAIKSGDIEVSQVLVGAGETMSLILQVTPPSVVKTGSYKITFNAVNEDGTVLKQIEFGANIVGSYKLDIVPSTLYTTVSTGGSMSFTVKVTNSGQSPVTALNLKVDAPSGWDVSVTPLKVNSVASTDSSTFTVITQIPGDTVAGDYMITLRAQSDQVNSNDVQLRVTTSAPTSWGLIGVGVALVVIVALIVMFRRFSRR
jgi:uncharacterized membrane protein